ncbi:MAG: hypothetical protein RMK29_18135 [Myxococcales bacterium]|nr:hypothetical protein [Myxococcota bacterium]MDW8283631.1 hypothetical protein [Myxococcales bacterium]
MDPLSRCSLLCVSLGLLLPACASGGLRGGGSSITNEQLVQRNRALEQLVVQALEPCKAKGKPQDHGIIMVTARPDGSLRIGEMQWLGSDEMRQCIQTEAPKARLAAWPGPSVTWIWAVGTKESPAPTALSEPPASYRERVMEHVQRAQARIGGAADASSGPLAACAQRTLPPEAYALVTYKLFIFPQGKVVGVTPLASEGDGRDPAYMDCVAETVREWTFDPFSGPGFTTLDVPLKYGVNPAEK